MLRAEVLREARSMMVFIAALFVFIWSTGFIVGKAIVPYADPTLFLFVRICIAAVLFTGVAWYGRVTWPPWREVHKHMIAGILLQGMYLSGIFWAISGGVPPAIMALVGSLQPLLTAAIAIPLLKEVPTKRIWIGLVLGMVGVFLVIQPALSSDGVDAFPLWAFFVGVAAVLSITFGTILQKTSIAQVDIRVALTLQNFGTLIFLGACVFILGADRWVWSPELWASLFWAAFVSTGVGTVLLIYIIRRGQAATASSLMFLAPPLAAIEAYFLFGDTLGPVQLAGFIVVLTGVIICNTRKGSKA
jgi:drug/metabolite transporter (DMT)-like permease|tara:strand:+ start:37194 stop:38102 length:909 start_codon:yes stop_codon:yes gene_type:complete